MDMMDNELKINFPSHEISKGQQKLKDIVHINIYLWFADR